MPNSPPLRVRPEIHRAIKILAAQRGETMSQTIAWLLSQAGGKK